MHAPLPSLLTGCPPVLSSPLLLLLPPLSTQPSLVSLLFTPASPAPSTKHPAVSPHQHNIRSFEEEVWVELGIRRKRRRFVFPRSMPRLAHVCSTHPPSFCRTLPITTSPHPPPHPITTSPISHPLRRFVPPPAPPATPPLPPVRVFMSASPPHHSRSCKALMLCSVSETDSSLRKNLLLGLYLSWGCHTHHLSILFSPSSSLLPLLPPSVPPKLPTSRLPLPHPPPPPPTHSTPLSRLLLLAPSPPPPPSCSAATLSAIVSPSLPRCSSAASPGQHSRDGAIGAEHAIETGLDSAATETRLASLLIHAPPLFIHSAPSSSPPPLSLTPLCPPAALEEEEGGVETKQRRRGRGSRGEGGKKKLRWMKRVKEGGEGGDQRRTIWTGSS